MTGQATDKKPKMKYRSFEYTTGIKWLGGKAGNLSSPEKPEFRVASPPEFRGESGVWTPEDLFVAAVESCTMTTFLSLVQRHKLPVAAYESKATGKLEFRDDGFRMTEILIYIKIVISDPEAHSDTEKAVRQAHSQCLIAKSITGNVEIVPEIQVDETTG
jgi:peroxiredoxin-like protein